MNAEVYTEAGNEDLTAYWHRHMAGWKNSGLSQQKFCKNNNLVYHQFLYWRHKLKQTTNKSQQQTRQPSGSGFASVSIQPATEPGLSLLLPNGLIIQGIHANNLSLVSQLMTEL